MDTAEELLQPLPSFLPDPKAALHPNFSLLRDAPAAPSPLPAQGLTKTSTGREPGCSGTRLPRAHPDNPPALQTPSPSAITPTRPFPSKQGDVQQKPLQAKEHVPIMAGMSFPLVSCFFSLQV